MTSAFSQMAVYRGGDPSAATVTDTSIGEKPSRRRSASRARSRSASASPSHCQDRSSRVQAAATRIEVPTRYGRIRSGTIAATAGAAR